MLQIGFGWEASTGRPSGRLWAVAPPRPTSDVIEGEPCPPGFIPVSLDGAEGVQWDQLSAKIWAPGSTLFRLLARASPQGSHQIMWASIYL